MQSPVLQALLATLFTWGVTALGAALVIFFKNTKKVYLQSMIGFAAGVMIAASFWSLLNPAIELADVLGMRSWAMVGLGFISGGFFLFLADKIIPHFHNFTGETEGPKTSLQRAVLLVLSITLHNIPEGLAVGVAFGAVTSGVEGATLMAAIALAIGIGIQNFPEGAAVSVPLRNEGFTRRRAFFYGQMSGMVEPIAGVLGAILVLSMRSMLPFALSFAAGAMIFVVVEELIPESQAAQNKDIATLFTLLGFTVMMILDVALG